MNLWQLTALKITSEFDIGIIKRNNHIIYFITGHLIKFYDAHFVKNNLRAPQGTSHFVQKNVETNVEKNVENNVENNVEKTLNCYFSYK